jgi:hypothetical protein
MKKNIIAVTIIMLFLVIACKSRYYRDIPYKFTYNQREIEEKLNITKYIPILDTLNQEYETNLTDRQIYLKEKYSIILGIKPQELKNYKFYDFIDQWVGTKYAKTGFSKDSLNVSNFISALYQYSFKRKLPITPLGMFKSGEISLFTGRRYLQEGDLIFFRYSKENPISDMGVYLRNNRILVSTKKDGLIISDFNQEYFQLRYIGAGRLIITEETEPK